jgi:hypothetical protein
MVSLNNVQLILISLLGQLVHMFVFDWRPCSDFAFYIQRHPSIDCSRRRHAAWRRLARVSPLAPADQRRN